MVRFPRVDLARITLLALSAITIALLIALVIWTSRSYRGQRVIVAAGSQNGESFVIARALKSVVERQFRRICSKVVGRI
jgi:hypothetical protein